MSDPKTKQLKALALRRPAATGLPAAAGGIVDCWNRIGVEGDGSCLELRKFIHCRNCPVYSSVGAQLLNRAQPPGYRRERTAYFADKRKPVARNRISTVIFRVGLEWLALPTHVIREVAEPRPVHSIPHRRHGALLGLVNIRGELLLCVSVGRVLGLDHGSSLEKLRTCHDRLLIVAWEGKRLVFPADEVHGIHRVQAEDVGAPPTTITKAALTFTRGVFSWQEKMVGLLEPSLLFSTLNRSFT